MLLLFSVASAAAPTVVVAAVAVTVSAAAIAVIVFVAIDVVIVVDDDATLVVVDATYLLIILPIHVNCPCQPRKVQRGANDDQHVHGQIVLERRVGEHKVKVDRIRLGKEAGGERGQVVRAASGQRASIVQHLKTEKKCNTNLP